MRIVILVAMLFVGGCASQPPTKPIARSSPVPQSSPQPQWADYFDELTIRPRPDVTCWRSKETTYSQPLVCIKD